MTKTVFTSKLPLGKMLTPALGHQSTFQTPSRGTLTGIQRAITLAMQRVLTTKWRSAWAHLLKPTLVWPSRAWIGLTSFVVSHDSDKVSNDLDKFWKKILACDKRNFKLTAGSNGQGENRGGNGIISGHAYSVISAFEVNHQGRSHRLVKLRNPWGKSEWNGLWSDSSSIWTP